MKLTKSIAAAGFALCLSAGSLLADSISPTSVSATIGVGGNVIVNKTVTVAAGIPTSNPVDVFFLSDTTGSMGPAISAVQAAASTILSTVSGLGDVAFAVGEYKDQPATSGDPFAYRLDQDITKNTAAVTAGINMWSAAGGGDLPEANLFGLQQAATTTSFRSGSARILVQFGDAPGHDPSGGVTEASAISALTANNVKVEAIDVGALTGGPGLNGTADGHTGEAGDIATATGGQLITGINTSTIVTQIENAIMTAVTTYSTVGLDVSGAPAGLTVVSSPDITGSFDRSIDRTFNFTLTITGGVPGTYDFSTFGTVDGGHVATETDHIVVGGAAVPDSGSALILLGLATASLGALRRKLA